MLAIFLNLFQTWQYAVGIIHPDAMNKKAYNYVFLRSDNSYKYAVAATDESFYGEIEQTPFFETKNNLEKKVKGWKTNNLIETASNTKAAKLSAAIQYGPSFEYRVPDSLKRKKNIYIVFAATYLEPSVNAAIDALFVVDVKDRSGKTTFYKAFRMKRLPDQITHQWREGSIGFKIPDFTPDLNSIKLYIWNKERKEFLVDDLELRFYTYRQ
jgi:hypothetical protein